LWEGILGEGEIFKLLNSHPLPIPLPSREREVKVILHKYFLHPQAFLTV